MSSHISYISYIHKTHFLNQKQMTDVIMTVPQTCICVFNEAFCFFFATQTKFPILRTNFRYIIEDWYILLTRKCKSVMQENECGATAFIDQYV